MGVASFLLALEPAASMARRDSETERPDALAAEFVRSGSDDVFALLVERYKDRVFRLVCSVLGPGREGEAEEVAQEVFLTVYHRLRDFRFDSSFSTWLYRITWRRAIDLKRKARYRLPHVGEESLRDLSEPGTGVVEALAKKDRARRVRTALGGVREPYRTTLYLHYWAGLAVAEIAAVLETREGTIKSHLFRGRRELASVLERDAS